MWLFTYVIRNKIFFDGLKLYLQKENFEKKARSLIQTEILFNDFNQNSWSVNN